MDIDRIIKITKELSYRLYNYEKKIDFYVDCYDDIEVILTFLRYNSLLTFHISNTLNYDYDFALKKAVIFPEYIINEKEYLFILKKIIDKLNVLKKQISFYKTDLSKELFIHNYLCKNIKYIDVGNDSHSIVGPLLLQQGVCEGIAKTVQMLFKIVGIKSYVIAGYHIINDEINPHAWNSVRIDGKWFLIDVTFDINLSNNKLINYDYFNVTVEDLNDSHKANYEVLNISFCKEKSDYFVENNIEFSDLKHLIKYIKMQINKRNEIIYCKLSKNIDAKSISFVDFITENFVRNIEYFINFEMNTLYIEITY